MSYAFCFAEKQIDFTSLLFAQMSPQRNLSKLLLLLLAKNLFQHYLLCNYKINPRKKITLFPKYLYSYTVVTLYIFVENALLIKCVQHSFQLRFIYFNIEKKIKIKKLFQSHTYIYN